MGRPVPRKVYSMAPAWPFLTELASTKIDTKDGSIPGRLFESMFFILPSNFGTNKVRLGERRREKGGDARRPKRKESRANRGKRNKG